ncbi:MAG: diaminopimelate decarboxylase, partial [Clostridia bacterium]|nr:diaminopimelate decarboxylase [Clostridia bacterium]
MLCENIGVSGAHLTFAGRDVTELAEKYGTPLYLMDEDKIRDNCRIYKKAMADFFGEGSLPVFASKAACFKRIYEIMKEENMGIDLVSSGELYTALSEGFDVSRAFLHGNNKTDFDINYAMDSGVGYFVVDNLTELNRIDMAAYEKGIVQKVILRLTPGIDPHTHAAVVTGRVDSKFGIAIETGQADCAVEYTLTKKNVRLCGFHCHIGSQIFEIEPFIEAAKIMVKLMSDIKAETGKELSELNLGGGYGIQYTKDDDPIGYGDYI